MTLTSSHTRAPRGAGTDRQPVSTTLLTALAGLLLLQAAWVLVVPPFRGLDEHDHAYKAAAVARGDYSATHTASAQGWGEFMLVPADLVEAASAVCETFMYTTSDNCRPGEKGDDGLVSVASSAARYNPSFYAVVGTAALPFDGVAALYAMRAAAGLLCALLMVAVVLALRLGSASPLPAVAVLLAATPMLVYATSVVAPNGLEAMGALLLWTALLGLRNVVFPSRASNALLLLATAGAIPLALVKTLGPLWLILVASTLCLLWPRDTLAAVARDRTARWCGVAVAAAVLAGASWTLLADTNAPTGIEVRFHDSPWEHVPGQWLVWFFQSMAAFPARDELAPMPLYVIGFLAWWLLVAAALRRWTRREAIAIGSILLIGTVIPVAATVITYDVMGTAWQGRYAYPYTMGALLICGFALDRAGGWLRTSRIVVWLTATVMLALSVIGQLTVLTRQLEKSPLAGTDAWWAPHPALVVALNVAGFALLAAALTRGRREPAATLRA